LQDMPRRYDAYQTAVSLCRCLPEAIASSCRGSGERHGSRTVPRAYSHL
jgi:hypothetical protein